MGMSQEPLASVNHIESCENTFNVLHELVVFSDDSNCIVLQNYHFSAQEYGKYSKFQQEHREYITRSKP